MKLEICPKCESDDIHNLWVKGRKLQQYCYKCGWKGEPRIPEQREIETIKHYHGNSYNHRYELFDKYGYSMKYSRGYENKIECVKEINKDLQRGRKDETAGPYTAVYWPPYVEVKGEVYK